MRRLLPPPLLLLLVLALVALHYFHPASPDRMASPIWFAGILGVFAIAGLAWARVRFSQSESEIMTFNTPRNLVTDGPFAISRNPMYLSMLLLVTSAALVVDRTCGLIAPLIFFAAANWWYIPFEEKAAAATFGQGYDVYRKRVRRWF
ncbi:MAG: isoprenylcysteine carboxylmethyltransferase family protein [Parasphingorhabdus sp.]|nr:isoprenylcysteine carboxylmethyltransferase family protein [Parasphingorhabdus sp.]